MQITIITDDKTVIVDGFPVALPGLDWSRFNGDPNTPWDDIRAVQFNSDRGQGHVEYKTIMTKQAARPDITPPNLLIGRAEFEQSFAWLLPAYEEAKARIEAQRARAEAATPGLDPVNAQPPENAVTREEMDAAVRNAVADFAQKLAAETGGV